MAGLHAVALTAKQEKAVVCLLNEPTVTKAAAAAGVGERTLYRWLDEPAFAAAYRKARRQAFGQSIALTQRYSPMAVQVLARIANDLSAPMSARVSAAQALLRHGRDAIELDDLAARIEELEAERGGRADPRGGEAGDGTAWGA